MFNRLLESNRKRNRRFGGVVASTIMHTLLIALAVRATQLTAAPPPKVHHDKIYAFRETPPEARPKTPNAAQPSRTSSSALVPPPATAAPPVNISIDVPGIPETGPTDVLTRNGDFGPPTLDPSRTGRPESPNVASGEPLEERYVDKPILAIPGTATPRYPASLQSAGLEGDVRAQFVVDTLGRVERGSVRVLDASHELFASSVRDALVRARFKPAEAGGHLVRQLAEQTFTFRITK